MTWLLAEAPAIPWVDGTLLFITVTVLGIIAAIWVYFDARRRETESPGLWAVIVGFLFLLYTVPGLVALIIYVAFRGPKVAGNHSADDS